MTLKELLSICIKDQVLSIQLGVSENDFYLRGTKEEMLKSGSTFDTISKKTVEKIMVEKDVLKVWLLQKE